jgi:hypothetical protein
MRMILPEQPGNNGPHRRAFLVIVAGADGSRQCKKTPRRSPHSAQLT